MNKDTPKTMTEIYAWIAIRSNGDEGIPALSSPDGPMPLVSSNLENMIKVKEYLLEDPNSHNYKFILFKFHNRTIVEIL